MHRMSLHLRGPIRRPLWNRLRRRLVQTSSAGVITTLVAGGALYVASAMEPNLSGVWVRDDGIELRLFQIGSRVTAIYESSDSVDFVANFTSRSRLEGYTNLIWEDAEMRKTCGHEPYRDHTFKATVNRGYNQIEYQWTRTTANKDTCAPTSFEIQYGTLRRKTT